MRMGGATWISMATTYSHVGYGHPKLKAAISLQMDALPFAPRRFTFTPATELAAKLTEISLGALSMVLFTTGGSDAVNVALKIARAATGRHRTISFWDSFHGAGFGAASVGGESLFRSHIIGPLLPGTEHVAPFACYRCPYGYPEKNGQPLLDLCCMTCANFVRYVLEREGDVAAVIAEPARAVPHIPLPGFWAAVRAACDAHGALLIFDEIPTSLGKTGSTFACDHDGFVPHIVVMGRALGGGILPLAAVLTRAELDVAGDYAFCHYTHEKIPISARAGLTTFEIHRRGRVGGECRTGRSARHRPPRGTQGPRSRGRRCPWPRLPDQRILVQDRSSNPPPTTSLRKFLPCPRSRTFLLSLSAIRSP